MIRSTTPCATMEARVTLSEHTILQIENNAANAELLKEIIARRAGLHLRTATNAQEGLELARTLQPDLVVMDMMMPKVNGLDALVLLRSGRDAAHIPVIILSSNAFAGVRETCLQAGAFAYLTKPYQIDALMATIDAALPCTTAGP